MSIVFQPVNVDGLKFYQRKLFALFGGFSPQKSDDIIQQLNLTTYIAFAE
jgi:hypothetical protein